MNDNKEIKNKDNKIRKVFLDDLPKRRESIKWIDSIGFIVHFIYNDIEGDIEIIDYKNGCLKIKYNNDIQMIYTGNFKNCKLGKILGKYTSDFHYQIGTIFKDNKRDITIISQKKDEQEIKRYKYHCNKCGWSEGWITEGHLTTGDGCSCCYGFTVAEGINDIPTTAPELIKYFQGGYDEAKLYTKSSHKKIYPICPDCGRIKDKKMQINNIYNYHSINCSCGDGISYPNKFMFNILEQLEVNFETEYSPEWISPKRYDFYIPSINKIIEMDGGFHFKDNNMSGQTKEETQLIDNYKDEQARLHGIEVIRINCNYDNKDRFEYIKQNIVNKLNTIVDLGNVNWNITCEFALSNLVKVACNYKSNNPNLTVIDIAILMGGYTKITIKSWLAQGRKIGWYYCDENEETI